jgi:hypothetical protein
LLEQKKINQRLVNEELLMAVLERLQDDIQLVADVQAVFIGCNEPPMDKQDGFLTGFPSESRTVIVRNLNAILTEMKSPSQVPGYAETHDDLREALFFCRTAVQMAVPVSEKEQGFDKISIEPQGRWQFLDGLRATIGIIPPESPETVRGGDTSVFSLPSDSAKTPMTSNVSLTTTITSAVTTPFKDRARRQKSAPNGLQLRRTIEILSTILHKMAVACVGLSNINSEPWNLGAEASIRLTEDIKRNYLQLLAVKQEDVKALVNAFSPATDDMQTKNSIERDDEGYMEEYDDLRRTVGSNDYCDDGECRDGPEERDGPDEREENYGDANNFSRALASWCSMEETDEYSMHKRELESAIHLM